MCNDYVEPIQRHYYRSIQDIWHDAFAWSRELPNDIIGFCGVPRSGIPIAHAIASSRNCHYVELSSLINGESTWREPIRRRMGKPHNTDGVILVVDDTSWSGGTMRHTIKPKLAHRTDIKIKYGALYFGQNGRSAIDYGFQQFHHVRQTFQHNLLHDTFAIQQSYDLDGVICEDCPSTEIDHNEAQYIRWMQTAKPLQIPTNTIGQIITARLEKYRPQTEQWLRSHGIECNQLIMLNGFDSNIHRNQTQDAGPRHKAEHYARLHHSTLFIESDDYQAQRIAELTGKSVVAWPSNRKWNCD